MSDFRKMAILPIFFTMTGTAPDVFAGGFGIATQSGSGTGNAFAGGAAVADDASVVWSNPAAMMALPAGKQFTAAGHFLKPSFKFSNTGSTGLFAAPGTGEGGDGGDWALVPSAFYTMDINPKLRFGVAVNVPFGLKTEYDAGWRGQASALKSEIITVNVNPSLAYKLSDTVSVGGGVSVQKLDTELSRFTGSAALGNVTLNADDIGYGFNLGLLVQATPGTRLGVSYRSSIKYDLGGTAVFSGPAGGAFNSSVKADLTVPESASFSVFSAINSKWEAMADMTWTRWSRLQRLNVIRTTASAGGAAGTQFTSIPFDWSDTWRFGIGANYRMNEWTKFRFGLAFDKTPTKDATRTPRLPDEQRAWAAVGVQHRVSKAGVLEVGYAHEFMHDAAVSTSEAGLPGALVGKFKNRVDIISIQYSHSF